MRPRCYMAAALKTSKIISFVGSKLENVIEGVVGNIRQFGEIKVENSHLNSGDTL